VNKFSQSDSRPQNGPEVLSEVKGIFSSDIIIRHALKLGLDDLRANPWQLNLIFASLQDDPYTKDLYGQKTLDKAKSWFLKTEIPVVMDFLLDPNNLPAITISLIESNEAEDTLGDTHYEPYQVSETEWTPLSPKVLGTYNFATNRLVLPESIREHVSISTQMDIVSKEGLICPIVQVLSPTECIVGVSGSPNFTECFVKFRGGNVSASLESARFKETYRVGCHVKGEGETLLWLHSIIVYCLLRYRKTLLEGRGFEVSQVNSGPFIKNDMFGQENVWSRMVSITGYVRQYWAQDVSDRIGTVSYGEAPDEGLKVSKVNRIATEFATPPGQEEPSYAVQIGDGIGVRLEDIDL
jgi:hypothetical protein